MYVTQYTQGKDMAKIETSAIQLVRMDETMYQGQVVVKVIGDQESEYGNSFVRMVVTWGSEYQIYGYT